MRYSAEEAAAIITQESQDNPFDLSDDGNDYFPVGSESEIESETDEYTESDITDEDELEQNVFGTGPIPKQRRGCQTRGGIKRGIKVSGERLGTQPPQDEWLGTQPSQYEQPAASWIAEEGEHRRDEDGDIGGNEKDNQTKSSNNCYVSISFFKALHSSSLSQKRWGRWSWL